MDQLAAAGRLMSGSSAHRGYGLKGQVSGTPDGPLVVLLQRQGPDEADDGVVVAEDAGDLGAPIDLAIQALDRIGGNAA